jgi:hypothetical protein
MTNSAEYLENLLHATQKPESEVMTRAFQIGVRQMWREHILGRYLRHEISRDKAVEAVGIDWVDMAERQKNAMMEDIEWAMRD